MRRVIVVVGGFSLFTRTDLPHACVCLTGHGVSSVKAVSTGAQDKTRWDGNALPVGAVVVTMHT